MKFAIIENNVVSNIIVADLDFIDAHYPNAINVDDTQCGIGWTYDGKSFIEPVVIDELEAE